MNASTDLIYSTLDRNTEGFDSSEFRCEIEKLSLEELNQYIDKFNTGESKERQYRDEKLRLCLRLRNAHLVRLPWFYTVRQHECHTTDTLQLLQCKVLFFFLNFKSEEELNSFKNAIQTFDLIDINVIFILNEQSYGQAEMEVVADKYPGYGQYLNCLNFLILKEEQYNHLVSRNLWQEIFNYTFLGNYVVPILSTPNDLLIFTAKLGNVFFANRYPEQDEIPHRDFKTCLQLLLQKTGMFSRSDFTAFLLIEVRPEILNHLTEQLYRDWDWMHKEMGITDDDSKIFFIKYNQEMQCPMRLSLVASMNS